MLGCQKRLQVEQAPELSPPLATEQGGLPSPASEALAHCPGWCGAVMATPFKRRSCNRIKSI